MTSVLDYVAETAVSLLPDSDKRLILTLSLESEPVEFNRDTEKYWPKINIAPRVNEIFSSFLQEISGSIWSNIRTAAHGSGKNMCNICIENFKVEKLDFSLSGEGYGVFAAANCCLRLLFGRALDIQNLQLKSTINSWQLEYAILIRKDGRYRSDTV